MDRRNESGQNRIPGALHDGGSHRHPAAAVGAAGQQHLRPRLIEHASPDLADRDTAPDRKPRLAQAAGLREAPLPARVRSRPGPRRPSLISRARRQTPAPPAPRRRFARQVPDSGFRKVDASAMPGGLRRDEKKESIGAAQSGVGIDVERDVPATVSFSHRSADGTVCGRGRASHLIRRQVPVRPGQGGRRCARWSPHL